MEKLVTKSSANYYLSEYLEDLRRAGVSDFYCPPQSERRGGSSKSAKPTRAPRANAPTRAPSVERAPIETRPQPTPDERGARTQLLQVISQDVASCSRCAELVANRTQTVFGTGDPCAELVFIGEGPGVEEDLRGEPFVGRSGQLLTDMIEKGMRISRSSVFICNIVRCRPPENRTPLPEEAKACRPFLDATLDVVKPRFICCLGSCAASNLLQTTTAIGKLRGQVWDYKGARVVCTYHPAYLLRNPGAKKQAWEDLQLLMKEMGLPIGK